MSGPQFAHLQTWSRKANPRGQSIQQVIEEALREPEFCAHVDDPQPPRVLLGDPHRFREEHDEHVAVRATIVRMKDGSEKMRSIRQDRHTMASIVVSYPVPRAAITTDEARAKYRSWEQRNLDWLRETYGDQLRVVLAHEDETHPHLHAWLLPDDPSADATTLHPGKVAKRLAETEAKAGGMPLREAVKAGNRSLKAAMTEWQDGYYQAVGAPEGLTRTGPKRRRLTREQWKTEKAAARVTATVATEAQAEVDRIMAGVQAVVTGIRSLSLEVEEGTIRQSPDGKVITRNPAALRPALSVLAPAILSAAAARTKLNQDQAAIAKEQRLAEVQRLRRLDVQCRWDERRSARLEARAAMLDARARDLDQRADNLAQAEADLDNERVQVGRAWRVLDRVTVWIAKRLGIQVLPPGLQQALDVIEEATRPKMRIRPAVEPQLQSEPSAPPPEDPFQAVEKSGSSLSF